MKPTAGEVAGFLEKLEGYFGRQYNAEQTTAISAGLMKLHAPALMSLYRAVTERCKYLPVLVEILQINSEINRPTPLAGVTNAKTNPWDERKRKARSDAKEYAQYMMESDPACLAAVAEGWGFVMHRFVYEWAEVISEMILGGRHYGYSPEMLAQPRIEAERTQRLNEMREQVTRACQSQKIAVIVPDWFIDYGRECARKLPTTPHKGAAA